MTRFSALLTASLLALSAPLGLGLSSMAEAQQSPFAPRLIINDRAISNFEFDQRMQFLKLLRAPGDVEKTALDGLIEDRLRLQEASRYKVELKEADLNEGMEEFAQRANMTAEQFTAELGKVGVAPETFRDFVRAGLVWREIVRGKFGSSARISDEEINRAIEGETRSKALTVSLTELILPAPPGREAEAMALAERIRREARSDEAFRAAVQEYSASSSRERGGYLDPMPLNRLPPNISGLLQSLPAGSNAQPFGIEGGVVLFRLRALSVARPADAAPVQVEYARLTLPAGGDSEAQFARLSQTAQRCNDLFGLLPGLAPGQLQVVTEPVSALATDTGLLLARLDPGETVMRDRAGQREMLMLCMRSPMTEPPVDRNQIRNRLLNQKLERVASQYLAELRANAIIREP